MTSKYIRHLGTPLALSFALVAAACAKKDDTLGADSALNRDLARAGTDTAAQPQLRDVPAATTSSTPTTTTKTTTTKTTSSSSGSTKSTPTSTTGSYNKTTSGNTVT